MKVRVLIVVVLTLCNAAVFAQSEDEREIRKLEDLWTQLLVKEDTTALRRIWTKEYVVNNPNGKIATGNDIIGMIKNKHKFPAVERTIEKITFNRNIAVVMGSELAGSEKTSPDPEQKVTRRFTNVWIRSKEGWQLAARQATGLTSQ